MALPDFTKAFEVYTNASNFSIGGVLMQEGHQIAFENKILNNVERRYSTHEREMTVVVHCLRTWRHYMLGAHCRQDRQRRDDLFFSLKRS